jgi:hypothetical protein
MCPNPSPPDPTSHFPLKILTFKSNFRKRARGDFQINSARILVRQNGTVRFARLTPNCFTPTPQCRLLQPIEWNNISFIWTNDSTPRFVRRRAGDSFFSQTHSSYLQTNRFFGSIPTQLGRLTSLTALCVTTPPRRRFSQMFLPMTGAFTPAPAEACSPIN